MYAKPIRWRMAQLLLPMAWVCCLPTHRSLASAKTVSNDCQLNFIFTVTRNGTNITDTIASSGHFPNQFIYLGMTAFVSEMMVANKTPCAIFASITLFLIVIKAIFLYIVSFASRTINGNLCMHNSNIPCSRCFLFGIFYSTFFRTPPKNFQATF